MFLTIIFLIFFGFISIFLFSSVIKIYNNLVEIRQQIDRVWANIDVILEQRHEEIPKLISIIEQFLTYERSNLDRILQAREKYISASSPASKIALANEISNGLQTLLIFGESNPQLQSSPQFLNLQQRISELESQIADRKELLNDFVTHYNVRCKQFPDVFLALIFKFKEYPLYKVPETSKTSPSLKIKITS